MTELSFLLDLLLTHKLPSSIKKVLVDRIKEVESKLSAAPQTSPAIQRVQAAEARGVSVQSASTQALLAKHGLPDPTTILPPSPASQEVVGPVAQIAQTPAAQAALQNRAAIINAGINGVNDGRKSPRKF